MARVSKKCPTCGDKQPCEIRMEPLGEQPTTQVQYTVKCLTCGNDHPPDTAEQVLDAKQWGKDNKAANDGQIKLE
jgi:hypothetical protein